MVRCCILHTNLKTGGAERQLLQLLAHWPDPAWQFDLVLLEEQGEWLHECPARVQRIGLSSQRPAQLPAQLAWASALVPRLGQLLEREQYDVVLTFLWLPTLLAALTLQAKGAPTQLVWSLQTDLGRAFGGRAVGRLQRSLVRNLAAPRINQLIACSQGVRERGLELLHIPAQRSAVIANCIDVARIERLGDSTVVPAQPGRPRIITVGRLHHAKHTGLLLEAFALLRQRGLVAECVIVGDGPERRALEQRAHDLGIMPAVLFVGATANPYAWLRSADLFVLPSRWETFGIALAEAMALGLPVIATASDGARELITPGYDGLLTPIGDAHELALAIADLLDDPARRCALGRQAQHSARRYLAPVIAERYHALLSELLMPETVPA